MTNEEYWTDKHDRGEPTVQVRRVDAQPFIATLDNAIRSTWIETVEAAVVAYHGEEVTDGTNRHYRIVEQLADYLTVHEMDFTESANPHSDEVDNETIARMYHLLRWQSDKYDI